MDQTGDSRMFVERLAAYASEKLGEKFLFGTTVEGLDVDGDRVSAVKTSAGPVTSDAVVISMGPKSGLLGRKYGIDLPVYPVKGQYCVRTRRTVTPHLAGYIVLISLRKLTLAEGRVRRACRNPSGIPKRASGSERMAAFRCPIKDWPPILQSSANDGRERERSQRIAHPRQLRYLLPNLANTVGIRRFHSHQEIKVTAHHIACDDLGYLA